MSYRTLESFSVTGVHGPRILVAGASSRRPWLGHPTADCGWKPQPIRFACGAAALICFLGGWFAIGLTAPRTHAATFVVTDAGDSGPGTLRAAIESANGTSGLDTIEFNLPVGSGGAFQDIVLTSDTLLITDSLRINNKSVKQVTVRRDTAAADSGLFPNMVSNSLADNMASDGPDFRELSMVEPNGAKKNRLETQQGHSLGAPDNIIGPTNLGTLGMNGGRVPTKAVAAGIPIPGLDEGSNDQGRRYDQNGGDRTRGAGTNQGAVESEENSFRLEDGLWGDSNGWKFAALPDLNDHAYITGGQTVDVTGVTFTVDVVCIGSAGGLNGEGTLTGNGANMTTANDFAVAKADNDFSAPFATGRGTVELNNSITLVSGDVIVSDSLAENGGIVDSVGTFSLNHGRVVVPRLNSKSKASPTPKLARQAPTARSTQRTRHPMANWWSNSTSPAWAKATCSS